MREINREILHEVFYFLDELNIESYGKLGFSMKFSIQDIDSDIINSITNKARNIFGCRVRIKPYVLNASNMSSFYLNDNDVGLAVIATKIIGD